MIALHPDEITPALLENLYPIGTTFIPAHIYETGEPGASIPMYRDSYTITKTGGFEIERHKKYLRVLISNSNLKENGATWTPLILKWEYEDQGILNGRTQAWAHSIEKDEEGQTKLKTYPNYTIKPPTSEKILSPITGEVLPPIVEDLGNIFPTYFGDTVPIIDSKDIDPLLDSRDIGIMLQFISRAEMRPLFEVKGIHLSESLWGHLLENGNYFNTRTLRSQKTSAGLSLMTVEDFLRKFRENFDRSKNSPSQRYLEGESDKDAPQTQQDIYSSLMVNSPFPKEDLIRQRDKALKFAETYGAILHPVSIEDAYKGIEDLSAPKSNEIPILGILPINNYKS